jgi:predicted metal-binding membrane protein
MGMSARDMTTLSLFPHLQAEVGGSMNADWPVVIAMWWGMMIAMMTPSSAPLILLYGLVLRRHAKKGLFILTFLLVSGYLIVWLAFAVIATAFQQLLEPAGLISGMMLWSQ